MKVWHAKQDDNTLTEEEKRKVAILKLVKNGSYVPNVGLRQDEYFLLEEQSMEAEALSKILKGTESLKNIRSELKMLAQARDSQHFMAHWVGDKRNNKKPYLSTYFEQVWRFFKYYRQELSTHENNDKN